MNVRMRPNFNAQSFLCYYSLVATTSIKKVTYEYLGWRLLTWRRGSLVLCSYTIAISGGICYLLALLTEFLCCRCHNQSITRSLSRSLVYMTAGLKRFGIMKCSYHSVIFFHCMRLNIFHIYDFKLPTSDCLFNTLKKFADMLWIVRAPRSVDCGPLATWCALLSPVWGCACNLPLMFDEKWIQVDSSPSVVSPKKKVCWHVPASNFLKDSITRCSLCAFFWHEHSFFCSVQASYHTM
jgi:hypothetical protein